MFAVIKAAGKQYIAVPGQKIKFDKSFGKKGESIVFEEVLLVADGDAVSLGEPTLSGVSVKGTVVREGRARKVITLKYKPKKRYKTKRGHRQPFSEVEILEIVSGASKSKEKKTETAAGSSTPKPTAAKKAPLKKKEKVASK